MTVDDGYACVEQAIKDYCGIIEMPQVIDPSDAADDTGEIWNAPAVLIDSGVLSQLNEPLAVLKGHIVPAAAPTGGLIEKYADKIRMGAMIFNDDGSDSECSAADPSILYNCSDPANRDGGKIISYIDQSAAHTDGPDRSHQRHQGHLLDPPGRVDLQCHRLLHPKYGPAAGCGRFYALT